MIVSIRQKSVDSAETGDTVVYLNNSDSWLQGTALEALGAGIKAEQLDECFAWVSLNVKDQDWPDFVIGCAANRSRGAVLDKCLKEFDGLYARYHDQWSFNQ